MPLSVLHGYRYVTPRDTARMILRANRVCKTGKYLDCVVQWAEIKKITHAFAQVVQEPGLVEPETFLAWYRDMARKERIATKEGSRKKNGRTFLYLPL